MLLKSAFSTLTDILRKARDGQETASQVHTVHTFTYSFPFSNYSSL